MIERWMHQYSPIHLWMAWVKTIDRPLPSLWVYQNHEQPFTHRQYSITPILANVGEYSGAFAMFIH